MIEADFDQENFVKKFDAQCPVRVPTNRGRRAIITKFFSNKSRRRLLSEFTLERDYYHYLEWDDSVEKYMEQPCTVPYYHDGKLRNYTPDVGAIIIPIRKLRLIEVKPREQILENFSIIESIKHSMALRGLDFEIVDDFFIRSEPRLSNLSLLYGRYSGVELCDASIYGIIKLFRLHDYVLPFWMLLEILPAHDIHLWEVYSMLWRKVIVFDLNMSLDNPETILTLDVRYH